MTPLDQLLLLSGLTVLAVFMLGNRPFTGWGATMLYALQGVALLQMSGLGYGELQGIESSLSFQVLGHGLHWGFDGLSWYFALITIGAAWLASWFASGEWGQRYREAGSSLRVFHTALALNVFGMLVLLASGVITNTLASRPAPSRLAVAKSVPRGAATAACPFGA